MLQLKAGLKTAIVLDHEYTQAGLSTNILKNRDNALYSLLSAATEGLDFELHLGLITLLKLINLDDDDDDDLISQTLTMNHLVDLSGKNATLSPAFKFSGI